MCKQTKINTKAETHATQLFPRKCNVCGDGMYSGYVIGGGEEYYCSNHCLHNKYSKKEWKALYNNGNSESYFTEWTAEDIDSDDEPIFEKNPL